MLYAFDTTVLFIKSICCIAHVVTRFCALYIIHNYYTSLYHWELLYVVTYVCSPLMTHCHETCEPLPLFVASFLLFVFLAADSVLKNCVKITYVLPRDFFTLAFLLNAPRHISLRLEEKKKTKIKVRREISRNIERNNVNYVNLSTFKQTYNINIQRNNNPYANFPTKRSKKKQIKAEKILLEAE